MLILMFCHVVCCNFASPEWATRDHASRVVAAMPLPAVAPLGVWRSRDAEVAARCGAVRERIFAVEFRVLVWWCKNGTGEPTKDQAWWLDHLDNRVKAMLCAEGLCCGSGEHDVSDAVTYYRRGGS